jgi:hypothetical protein
LEQQNSNNKICLFIKQTENVFGLIYAQPGQEEAPSSNKKASFH